MGPKSKPAWFMRPQSPPPLSPDSIAQTIYTTQTTLTFDCRRKKKEKRSWFGTWNGLHTRGLEFFSPNAILRRETHQRNINYHIFILYANKSRSLEKKCFHSTSLYHPLTVNDGPALSCQRCDGVWLPHPRWWLGTIQYHTRRHTLPQLDMDTPPTLIMMGGTLLSDIENGVHQRHNRGKVVLNYDG